MKNWFLKLAPYLVFLLINIWFNFPFWNQLFLPQSDQNLGVTDGSITELITEVSYRNMFQGKSPFSRLNEALYPFGINYSLNDPGISNSFLFIVFRPLLSVNQSMISIILLNIFMANILMFKLLKKMNVSPYLAMLMALVYGFMPFVSHRLLGHYTYTAIYLFPGIMLLILKFVKEKRTTSKIFWSVSLGLFLAWSLFTNFYYFISIVLALGFMGVWYLIFQRQVFLKWATKNAIFTISLILTFLLAILPWLVSVYSFLFFENRVQIEGFGGAIFYSADLLNFITPNQYNPLYQQLFSFLSKIIPQMSRFEHFYLNNWERFVYPGLIIIMGFLSLLVFWKRIPKRKKKNLLPYLYASIFFASLCLGPFLKFLGKWQLYLEEVSVVIPMPFLILHYLPGLESMRVPGRFAPAFVFFSVLVVALTLQELFKLISLKKQITITILLFLVFLGDQYYKLPQIKLSSFPASAYQKIANDPKTGTILDIPYTVRDGFDYLGFVHAISPMQGLLIHQKPMMGGYFARVDADIFTYYSQLPFLGYVAKITDKGNYNPLVDPPGEPNVFPHKLSSKEIKRELDFFDINFILLKTDEKYSEILTKTLKDIEAYKNSTDQEYTLYSRSSENTDFSYLDFGKKGDELFVASGFGERQAEYRPIVAKTAKVFLKNKDNRSHQLIIKARTNTLRTVDVYLNEKFIDNLTVSPQESQYIITTNHFKSGVNTLFLKLTNIKSGEVLDENNGIQLFSIKIL